MKTKNIFLALFFLGTIGLLSACSNGINGAGLEIPEYKGATLAENNLLYGTNYTDTTCTSTLTGAISETDASGLLFMREEEKLARDVYTYLYDKYKLPVFLNISKSESAHVAAVLRLIDGFKISDNSSNAPGVYVNPQLTDLYKQLIDMGNLSVNDALKVGVLIEQTDINDLSKELLSTQNSSIQTVYNNLKAASNAHLKAFSWNLKVRGVVYP